MIKLTINSPLGETVIKGMRFAVADGKFYMDGQPVDLGEHAFLTVNEHHPTVRESLDLMDRWRAEGGDIDDEGNYIPEVPYSREASDAGLPVDVYVKTKYERMGKSVITDPSGKVIGLQG